MTETPHDATVESAEDAYPVCPKCRAKLINKYHVSGGAHGYEWSCGSVSDPFVSHQSDKCRLDAAGSGT